MDNNEVFDNQPRFINLSKGEVLVRFSKDAEGNEIITFNPEEMLTDVDRVIHFLDEPHGDKEYIESKTKDIINHYNLHEYIGTIKLETNGSNIIYFCGRLCEELLIHRFDCTREDSRTMRDDVENKIKRLKDPRIIDELRHKYPNAKVVKGDLYADAKKEPEIAPVLSFEDTGIIVATPNNRVVEEIHEEKIDIISQPDPPKNSPTTPSGSPRIIL